MQPLSRFPRERLRRVRVLAADVDDTITRHGKLPRETVACLESLEGAGIAVALVTGRPAGWAQALAGYLPGIRTAVAENGLVAFAPDGARSDLGPRRPPEFCDRLAENAARVRRAYDLAVTPDDAFRLFERAFIRPRSFDGAALAASGKLVEPGFEVIASSIHIHVRPSGWSKADGLLAALAPIDGEASRNPEEHVAFVGDSSNDRPLFARLRHTSVGVRNVIAYVAELGDDQPAYITEQADAAGFAELVGAILAAR